MNPPINVAAAARLLSQITGAPVTPEPGERDWRFVVSLTLAQVGMIIAHHDEAPAVFADLRAAREG